MQLRRFRRIRTAGLCAAIAFGVVSVASAKPSGGASTAAQPVEIARLRYRQGVEAYQAKRYREAIDYFLEADRLSPSAALSFNIARAYENTNDAPATLRWYRDYLRRDPNAADKADVENVIRTFEKKLADKGVQQVTFTSDPTEAEVEIDGKPVGVTPLTLELAPGTHALALHHSAYAEFKQDVDIPGDHASDMTFKMDVAAAEAPPPPTAAPVAKAPEADASAERGKPSPILTPLGWAGIGLGGAALGGALVFELLRHGAESDAKADRTQVDYADHLDTMEGRRTAARVLLGTGVVLAAAGGVLLYLGHDSNKTTVGLACAPGGCMSAVRGRF
jgi:tetratricopeptide (TPR) repeat protein